MENERNILAVRQIYADFGKQNIEGVLGALTDDVSWFDPGYPYIPYAAKRKGIKEVMSFFMEMGSTVSFSQFIPQEFYAEKNVVIVKGFFAGKANGTGKTFETDWVMIWKFRSDKVFNYQAFVDTAAISAAIK